MVISLILVPSGNVKSRLDFGGYAAGDGNVGAFRGDILAAIHGNAAYNDV